MDRPNSAKEAYLASRRAAMVDQIKKAEPHVQWNDVEVAHDKGRQCEITLPHNCSIRGIIFRYGSESTLELKRFNVPDELQRNGIGRILLEKLAEEARSHKVTKVSGNIASEGGLNSMAGFFGQENLRLASPENGESIGFDQAVTELKKPDRKTGVPFSADMPAEKEN
jgi:GNAT superfamily N-acetyltransferase